MAYLLAHDVDRPEMPKSGAPEANTTLRLLGAAPLPVEVDQVIRSRFGIATFSGAYGVTEASLVSWQPPGTENRPNAAGVVNDEYFDVRIFDDDDDEVAPGTEGEIVLAAQAPPGDVRGLLGPARRDGADDAATSGTTPATSGRSTKTATSTSSTARRTICGDGARTSPASRSSGSSWATGVWPTWPCTRCRAR